MDYLIFNLYESKNHVDLIQNRINAFLSCISSTGKTKMQFYTYCN